MNMNSIKEKSDKYREVSPLATSQLQRSSYSYQNLLQKIVSSNTQKTKNIDISQQLNNNRDSKMSVDPKSFLTQTPQTAKYCIKTLFLVTNDNKDNYESNVSNQTQCKASDDRSRDITINMNNYVANGDNTENYYLNSKLTRPQSATRISVNNVHEKLCLRKIV